ncbi:YkvA family protein [Paenibacillus sp. NEAU-GSW1]|uniref:YkvA family protein n=1 Tax=Paenibacillus sp. NEAU-GSW1 TaxID=2682486 RepID=UPI0012E3280A|nr:DUF1232 domain-containing protein [Paenibacillus sp. NEAU-GSW1]MUT66151.1 DUF1232 domain-containing protein [Paenibacillus sp. NEAU-GSW1]
MSEESKYDKHYSEDGFWTKLKKHAISAGQKVVYSGLTLYYALESPNTSLKDKAIIYGGLGYLILPVDALPDPIPVAGYSDDLGVLLFAAARVALSIDAVVKQKAKAKLEDFFGSGSINRIEIDEVDKQIDGDEDDAAPSAN